MMTTVTTGIPKIPDNIFGNIPGNILDCDTN
jgi:hypothetical protein